MFDLLIKNGRVMDGTGSPSFAADVAVKNGKIAAVGFDLGEALRVIDATGLLITPGFVDSHSHSDQSLFSNPEVLEKVEQGITTAIGGQCGSSACPAKISEAEDRFLEGVGKKSEVYANFTGFVGAMKNVPFGANHALLIGAGNVRRMVMGMDQRAPTPEQMDQMKAYVREAMENGALGISFGLIYPPGCYFKEDEMVELAKVVAEYHGLAACHLRNEGKDVIRAQAEFISVLRRSGCRGVHSHLKSFGSPDSRGQVKILLENIDRANAEGVEMYFDVYPYIASHTTLSVRLVPDCGRDLLSRLADPEEREKIRLWNKNETWWKGDLSGILIASCAAHPEYEGKFISELAREHGVEEIDIALDMILESKNKCTACFFTMDEADVEMALSHPRGMICTDSRVASGRTVFHPRLKASFPRALARYTRREGLPSLEEMVRKMTSLPAKVYGLSTKGILRVGMDADLCVFDPEALEDKATFAKPDQRCVGFNFVIVGGSLAAEGAVSTEMKKGKLLLREDA